MTVAACLPVAVEAPFTQDPAQRQSFVNSVQVGATNVNDLIARWGKPTGIGTAETGRNPDQVYTWAGTVFGSGGGGVVIVRADHTGIVETVRSTNGQGVPDNFKAGAAPRSTARATPVATAAPRPTTAAPAASSNPSEAAFKSRVDAMRAFGKSGATIDQFRAKFGAPTDYASSRVMFVQLEETLTYGTPPSGFRFPAGSNYITVDFKDGRFEDVTGYFARVPGRVDYF